ncbi:MAG: hypothetical protein OQJ83_02380 [Altibacter sp.]|nr:hypothetical protein [Altibacter sp.]
MKKNIFTIILFLIGINFGFAQNATIEGKLVPIDTSDYEIAKKIEYIFMPISNEKHRLAKVNTDLTFIFENVESDSITLIVPATIKKSSFTLFLKNDETKNIEIPISYYCEYDKSENDKTCPVCKKTNRVIPTCHSMLYTRKCHSLGCLGMECEPNWYCKRDKITF